MDQETIKKQLINDIEALREPTYGYIQAGLPMFPALFGRDSCIIAWQLLDYDTTIAERTIKTLADFQGKKVDRLHEEEPGKILHEWHPDPGSYKPLDWPLPYFGSVDSTPLFLILCGLYFAKVRNVKWLGTYWPNIEAALLWCSEYGDSDGNFFLEYARKNPDGLLHQGWKDSGLNYLKLEAPVELVEVQGYYYAALMATAQLADALEKKAASELRSRAAALREHFLERYRLPIEEFFAVGFGRSGAINAMITSNPGHLLFTGILDGREKTVEAVVRRLFAPDMWTSYGIRTHSEKNPDFNPMSRHLGSIWPHDNWIIAQGLKRYGYLAEYQRVKTALLDAYDSLGEIPELYAVIGEKIKKIPDANSPQGWASGALLHFILSGE